MVLRVSEAKVPWGAQLPLPEMNEKERFLVLKGQDFRIGLPWDVCGGYGWDRQGEIYRGRQGVDHSWGTQDHCLMTVLSSSFLVSALGPSQQNFRSSDFWLLLLNARMVCNKSFLISNLITVERANLAYLTKTWLGQKGRGVGPFGDKPN